MNFHVLTLFPEMVMNGLSTSIIGRAMNAGLLSIEAIDIRDYAENKHNRVDDYPYGGGAGMVMQAEPLYQAYQSLVEGLDYKPKTIYLSPQGKTFRQSTAKRLVKDKHQHLIFLCGHYEGVDQRLLDEIVDMELSLGDFVLTGGEIAAMAMVDATARMIPGVLKSEEAFSEESHFSGLLEYPQYTRPEIWHDRKVPEILLSGHHKNIQAWKREMSIRATFQKRRGMLAKANLSEKEKNFVEELKKSENL